MVDIDSNSQVPPQFSIVAIAASQKLLALQVGDLGIVHGRITRNLRGEQRVAVLDIQQLAIEGEQGQAEEAAV